MRWLRPLNLLVNGAMIAATPIGGGHFLFDVLVGGSGRRRLDLCGPLERRQPRDTRPRQGVNPQESFN